MSASQTILRLQKLRDSWCILREVDGAKPELAVCLRRPPEADLIELRPRGDKSAYAMLTDTICRVAVDWRGFSEAELFGAAIGSADPLPFDAGLWAEVVRDRGEWIDKCSTHLFAEVNKHRELREEQAKN